MIGAGFTLETERLVLREPAKQDAGAVLALIQQPFVRRYNCFGDPPTLEKMEKILMREQRNQLVLCLKETGIVIGHIGMDQDSLRYRVESICLDCYLGEEYSRKGYMSEALKALICRLFREHSAEVICARSFAENTASIALLTKLGFTREGTLRQAVRNFEGKVFDDVLFSLLKIDFEKRGGFPAVSELKDRPLFR